MSNSSHVNRKRRNNSQQGKVSPATTVPAPPAAEAISPQSGRSSPENEAVCSICLGRHENKCYTNKCFHEFCFTCLLQWSMVKAECPLCKQSFSSIIHNVRDDQDFDEHQIPVVQPEDPGLSTLDSVHRLFRYRTTMTQERRSELALERLNANLRHFRDEGVLPRETRRRRSHVTGPSNYRRQIYQRDLWVRPLSEITGRYRETTPEFFLLNPAMKHRLSPWLNRELNVVLTSPESRLPYVLELIERLIEQHHICSRPFREALRQHMGGNTDHFVHEFFQFARSPYDMFGFDENADYQPRNNLQHEEVAVSESSDEDVVLPSSRLLNTVHATPSEIPLPPSPQPGPSGLNRATLSDDGQSYSVRAPINLLSEEDDEDVEIIHVVRPSTPEIITLSDSEEEEEATDQATGKSSRGKALKQKSIDRRAARKPKKKKTAKRDRSASPGTTALREHEEERVEPLRRSIHHRHQMRYWEMDPEEIRQLHRQADSSGAAGKSKTTRSSKSTKRNRKS